MVAAEHIRKALSSVGALGGQMRSLDELAAGANDALRQAPAGLTTQGAAAFLATMAQESAWFRTTEEYAKNGRYAPFIGRTFEQITWRDNYAAFGAWCKAKNLLTDADQFVRDPKSLADYRWAWLGGVWYFEARNLWPYANRGDFLAVARTVNLGSPTSKATPAGWATRKKAYDAFVAIGAALLPEPAPVIGSWIVDPTKVTTTLNGRASSGAVVASLRPGETVAGVRVAPNALGRDAVWTAAGISYDLAYLTPQTPAPKPPAPSAPAEDAGEQKVPVHPRRPFPVIPTYTTIKVRFRGVDVCRCVAESLPWVEYRMLEAGLIRECIDIFQGGYNRGGVPASAGTHDAGWAVDVGQYSDAQLKVWREMGWQMQRRTPAEGFAYHGHGGPKGCTHGSAGAKDQQREWDAGRNGLRDRRAITGPAPKGRATPRWDAALAAYKASVGA